MIQRWETLKSSMKCLKEPFKVPYRTFCSKNVATYEAVCEQFTHF